MASTTFEPAHETGLDAHAGHGTPEMRRRIVQVGTGAEGLALGAQQAHAVLAVAQAPQRGQQFVAHARGHGVAFVGAFQRDDGHAVFGPVADPAFGRGCLAHGLSRNRMHRPMHRACAQCGGGRTLVRSIHNEKREFFWDW